MNKIRKIPPVCLCIALARLLKGSLRFPEKFLGTEVNDEDRNVFRIFRNIKMQKQIQSPEACVFVVSFKFARLSHKANKLASIIPMLLIAGFPGFIQKMYAVNADNGYWMGLYEWKSKQHLEAYLKSFVFRMMNRRALPNSISMVGFEHLTLDYYIRHPENRKSK